MNFENYLSAAPTRNPNAKLIPVNNFRYIEEDISKFNEIYQYCLNQIREEFVLTPSGGISTEVQNWRGVRWILRQTSTVTEIWLKDFDGRYYRFQIGYRKTGKKVLCGHQAFKIYLGELKKDGIDLKDYYIENGLDVKLTIPSPRIEFFGIPGRTYYNVHHLDINSSYNAGMMEAFPFLEKTVRRLYEKRKDNNEKYKDVLNMTQGVMQSSLCAYRLSHISKAGYEYTNRKLEEYSKGIENAGGRIIAYNVDGIWYQKDEPYHDEFEGSDIGQWKTDHKNCKIRFKSPGCYEFVEENRYTPVVRGSSTLDRFKPREDWEWGDIFNGVIINFYWVDGYGFMQMEDNYNG